MLERANQNLAVILGREVWQVLSCIGSIFNAAEASSILPPFQCKELQSPSTAFSIEYSQIRIKETHWAVRKGFLLSIVSFISCSINVESLTCIKSEE